MKCSDSTAQMIGQCLIPSAAVPLPPEGSPNATVDSTADATDNATNRALTLSQASTATPASRYRLLRLLLTEPGKRTFLAVDEQSQTQVIVKIVLFGADPINPNPSETVAVAPLSASDDTTPDTDTEDADTEDTDTEADPFLESLFGQLVMLPYLDSFEVETPLGAGLALIKLCTLPTESSLLSTRQPTSNRRAADLSSTMTTRYPVANSVASGLIPSKPLNRRRPGSVTRWPRMSYGDFKVRTIPDKMEVRCQSARIREGKIVPTSATPFVDSLERWIVVILATFGFVGGAVISTGSIVFGLVVAAFLPLLFHQLIAPKTSPREQAILRFASASGGQTFFSLTTVVMPPRRSAGQPAGIPTESKLHSSRLSVGKVKIAPAFLLGRGLNPIGAEIVFTFYNANAQGCDRLRIVGSYSEMRWLSRHLSTWSNARNLRDSADAAA